MKKEMIKKLSASMENMALAISGRTFKIVPIEDDELAYTAKGNKIYIGFNHPMVPEGPRGIAFLMGLMAHELMHQLITPFNMHRLYIQSIKSEAQKRVFATLFNVIEDPAIEYQSSEYLGEKLLNQLHYTIWTTYKEAPNIDETADGFTQYIQALIQYGDGGILKGSIADAQAQSVFASTLPLIDQAIEEESGEKRLKIAYEVFQMSKPLWEEQAKQEDVFEQMMRDLMEQFGKNTLGDGDESARQNGSGNQQGAQGGQGSSLQRKRKITFRRVTKEEAEKIKQNSKPTDGNPDGDIEVLIVEDDKPTSDATPREGEASNSVPEMGESSETQPSQDGGENGESGATSSDANTDKQSDEDGCGVAGGSNAPDTEDVRQSKNRDAGSGSQEPQSDSSETSDAFAQNSEADSGNGCGGSPDNSVGSAKGATTEKDSSNDSSQGVPSEPAESQNQAAPGDSSYQMSQNADSVSESGSSGGEGSAPQSAPLDLDASSSSSSQYDMTSDDQSVLDEIVELSEENLADVTRDWKEWMNAVPTSDRDDEDIESLDIPAAKASYPNINTLDRPVRCAGSLEALDEAYQNILEAINPQIRMMTKQLTRIIRNAREEREWKTSGKLSIERVATGRTTARVFMRKKGRSNASDCCVYILIDHSGSMSGTKIECAKLSAIALAETFGQIGVPTKIVGFHDLGGTVVQEHYTHWKNTLVERKRLLNINAGGCNMDGYSIRYATECLKKRPEERKILIVCSDGQPSSSYYGHSKIDALSDVKQAIQQAAKQFCVVGVGIGNTDTQVLYELYGRDFILCQNPDDLFSKLHAVIAQKFKKYKD